MVETMVSTSFGVSLSVKKNPRVALIDGINGQDGSYLAELLLEKGYEVHGILRRSSTSNTKNIDHIRHRLILHHGDVCDSSFLDMLLYELQPHEIYHLAAQSHVGISFDLPAYTADVVAMGTLRMLEAVRRYSPYSKMYNSSSSELFGNAAYPQNEDTVMHPNNPYAVSKLFAHEMTRFYRQSYGLFVCSGILFNHTSPRRGDEFVSQKIVKGLLDCKEGKAKKLLLGNLDAKRDWGFAGDYVEMQWLMLQQQKPDDYVIGIGEAHSVRDFLKVASSYIIINWEDYVEISQDFIRPLETNYLLADARKAQTKLGWKPKTSFNDLVAMMVKAELDRRKNIV
jgi:GDPmannose 4,6-dehydratase